MRIDFNGNKGGASASPEDRQRCTVEPDPIEIQYDDSQQVCCGCWDPEWWD